MSGDAADPILRDVPGTDAGTFIQWKSTDVCLDLRCPCGVATHFDGFFAYVVQCCGCGALYELGTAVLAVRRRPDEVDDRVPLNGD